MKTSLRTKFVICRFSRLNEQVITADFVWFSWSESGKIESPKVANMAFYCAKIEQICATSAEHLITSYCVNHFLLEQPHLSNNFLIVTKMTDFISNLRHRNNANSTKVVPRSC